MVVDEDLLYKIQKLMHNSIVLFFWYGVSYMYKCNLHTHLALKTEGNTLTQRQQKKNVIEQTNIMWLMYFN